jgi:ornithine cyclodeaminase/alanine dehydrogenase-like protein (mu-crystallin family)
MKRALVLIALGGCVSGAGLIRKDRVTVPILIGAAVADLVVGSLVFAQADLSTAGAIASGIAFTAVDVGIGCIIGACAPLRP